MKWASPLVLCASKEEVVAKFLWWVVTSIVNVILKSFFYITELDHQPRTKVSEVVNSDEYGALFTAMTGAG